MELSPLIDDATKLISAGCGVLTLFLAWKRILPRLEEIHQQTNSLAVKAEAGAHALGVQEGLKLASDIDPAAAAAAAAVAASAAKLVLDAAAERAAKVLSEASNNERKA